MDGSTARWRVWWPVVAMLIVVVLLGYPLALLFGLPLARRDMVDLRKWIKETVVAQAPLVPDGATLHYNTAPAAGALIWRQALIGRAQVDPGTERVPVPNGFDAPVTIGPPFERLGPVLFRGATPLAADEVGTAIYTAGRLQMQGSVLALERPDGQATRYTLFGNAGGPVFIDVRPLEEGADYVVDGDVVVFAEAPPFGSQIRRVSSDYAVVDGSSGLVLFASPPEGNVVLAESVVRLAEVLAGEADGTNLRFRFARANILDGDGRRRVFVEDRLLNPVAERPEERVDGERATFTFESDAGIVAVDGVPSTERSRLFARRQAGNVCPVAAAKRTSETTPRLHSGLPRRWRDLGGSRSHSRGTRVDRPLHVLRRAELWEDIDSVLLRPPPTPGALPSLDR